MFIYALAETGATGMADLSTNAGSVIELVKTAMTLFTEFPLNVMLVASLVGVGFGIFRKARKASGGGN